MTHYWIPKTIKYWAGVWQEIVCLIGRKNSSALDGSLSKDGVSIKTLVETIKYNLKQSKMSNQELKIKALMILEQLVVKVLCTACMGYPIWPQQVVIRQHIKQKENEIRWNSKQDCNWVLAIEWSHKKKIETMNEENLGYNKGIPVTGQWLEDQARQIQTKKRLTNIEIEEKIRQ